MNNFADILSIQNHTKRPVCQFRRNIELDIIHLLQSVTNIQDGLIFKYQHSISPAAVLLSIDIVIYYRFPVSDCEMFSRIQSQRLFVHFNIYPTIYQCYRSY